MTTLKRWFAEQKFTNAFKCCRLRLECRQGRVWVKENIPREQQSAQERRKASQGVGMEQGDIHCRQKEEKSSTGHCPA